MPDTDAPDWIEALSAALPGTDRRALEGWAVWLKTLWSDSSRALALLQAAAGPEGLTGGPAALLRHLALMGRHLTEVEDHLQRLSREITGTPYARPAGSSDEDVIELKTALRTLLGTLDDFEVNGADARQPLRDELDEAIREATALRGKLGDA